MITSAVASPSLFPTAPGQPARRIDRAIDQALSEGRIVGTVVLIARDGQPVYRRAAGFADREAGRPMREDALFRLASVTKLIVSVAALALVSRGTLALDMPVTSWLPAFRPPLPDGTAARITLRHLMTHTAGFGYGFLEPESGPYHRAGISDGMDRVGFSLDENLRRLAAVPLLYPPGTAWTYSLATDVLGAVVAAAFGAPLPNAVHALVTAPLGLADTAFDVRDAARLATPYASDAPAPRRMREPDAVPMLEGMAPIAMDPGRAFDTSAFPSGGAGMVGSADDILRLLETLRTGGGALLPPALVAEMGRGQTGDLDIPAWPGWGFGLGFSVLRDQNAAATPEAPGTWRWGGAYGHSWFVDHAPGLSVVALTNTALEGMSGGGRFPQDLRDAVYGA